MELINIYKPFKINIMIYEAIISDKMGNKFPLRIDKNEREADFHVWVELPQYEMQCYTTIGFDNINVSESKWDYQEELFETDEEFQLNCCEQMRDEVECWFNSRKYFQDIFKVERM